MFSEKNNTFLTLLFVFVSNLSVFSQELIIGDNYIKQHHINRISFVLPLDTSWLNRNIAFDNSLNAQYFDVTYNPQTGQCLTMNWQFCKLNGNCIDTSIATLHHSFLFDYENEKLSSIMVNSTISLYKANYRYEKEVVYRTIAFINQQNTLEYKIDTTDTMYHCVFQENPFYFPAFPEQKCVEIPASYLDFVYLNQINILELIDTYNIILIPSPIVRIEYR